MTILEILTSKDTDRSLPLGLSILKTERAVALRDKAEASSEHPAITTVVPVPACQQLTFGIGLSGVGSVLETACKAVDELDRSMDFLKEHEIDSLLNAAFASQKLCFRTLHGEFDAEQQRLYTRLTRMIVGRTLPSTRYGISEAELTGMALSLPMLLETAYRTVDQRRSERKTVPPRKSQRTAKGHIPCLPAPVLKARIATQGKRLLIVGGICKEADRQRIAQALDCEVEWLNAKKGEGLNAFKKTASHCHLLVSLVKLSSHAHTDGMGAFSRQSGIPLVRICGGFNPVAIADAVNRQILRTA